MSSLQQNQPEQNQNETQVQPQTIDYYYTKFDSSHIDGSEPREKSFDSQNGKVTYKELPLSYNYGTLEAPIIDSCYFECPEVSCYGGIVSKKESKAALKDGDSPYLKESFSMMFTFNLQDPECVACLKKMDELHKGSARVLAKHKGKVGMYSFNPDHPGEIYKHPIYYKIDPVTCERVAGRNPTLWVKLNVWKNNRTLFTDINENVIDWALLSDVELKMIPLLHVEKIYVGGGKASLQIKLHSAIVTDIVHINTRTRQTATIDRLKQRKGLADTVASQLAQMRMERQDTLDGGHVHPKNAVLPETDAGAMHNIPKPSNGFQGTQENLTAYLGGAPAMNNQFPTQSVIQQNAQSTQTIQLPTAVPSVPTFNINTGNTGNTQASSNVQHAILKAQAGSTPVNFSGQQVLQIK